PLPVLVLDDDARRRATDRRVATLTLVNGEQRRADPRVALRERAAVPVQRDAVAADQPPLAGAGPEDLPDRRGRGYVGRERGLGDPGVAAEPPGEPAHRVRATTDRPHVVRGRAPDPKHGVRARRGHARVVAVLVAKDHTPLAAHV